MKYKGWIAEKGTISIQDLINDLDNEPNTGAITTFIGLVRAVSDHTEIQVTGMEVEGWMEKGEEKMTEIAIEIGEKYQLLAVRIVHLTGMLDIGDSIVLVVLASIHRKEAFDALEDTIQAYKNQSPVWKKEIYSDGTSKWITTAKS